jgi:hypothetical protein
VVNDLLVRVKFRDIPADILFPRVPEQIQFRLVRPKDRAIRTHPVQTHYGVFDKITERRLASP